MGYTIVLLSLHLAGCSGSAAVFEQHCYGDSAWLQMQERFMRAYLDSALALQHCIGLWHPTGPKLPWRRLPRSCCRVPMRTSLMSHLIWDLWGLLQVRPCLVQEHTLRGVGDLALTSCHDAHAVLCWKRFCNSMPKATDLLK